MNEQKKKSCFAEISHLICDCDKKVNINDISNNWNLSFRDSESLLLEWLKSQKNRVLTKEYIIRGVDKSERCFISVVPERRLASLEKRFPKFCSSLYSLELPSESNRLGNVELSKTNHIRLPLEGETRACKVLPINIPNVKSDANSVKAETSKPIAKKNPVATMFAAKPAIKSEDKPKPQPDKTESATTARTETKTPKKESPKKKGAVKAQIAGKSSISLFFSTKPVTAKSSEPKSIATTSEHVSNRKEHSNGLETMDTQEKDIAVSLKKESPKEKPSKKRVEKTSAKKGSLEKADKSSNKRSFVEVVDSDDEVIMSTPQDSKKVRKVLETNLDSDEEVIMGTPQVPKKVRKGLETKLDSDEEVIMGTPQDSKKVRKILESKKKKKTPSNKHSRIRQIVDSSDSDEGMAETKVDSPSPVKDIVDMVPKIDINKRRRAKRTVTRTYQDKDGYLTTEKEVEEYSCSDEDDVVVESAKTVTSNIIKSDPVKKNAPTTSNGPDKGKTTKKEKKITPPKAGGTKQGSILSFFNKK